MAKSEEWAGGARDKERKWSKFDNAVVWADLFFGTDPADDFHRSQIDDINESARAWKQSARSNDLEYHDPKADTEAFALPGWGERLQYLRGLGLPIQRVRSLVRGVDDGVAFSTFCVCDADENGKVIPYRLWVFDRPQGMPELVCDQRARDEEVPDGAAWCESTGTFTKIVETKEGTPVIKEGNRLTGSRFGRALAGKINDFVSGAKWLTVWGGDPASARAAADRIIEDRDLWGDRVVWVARGPLFVYGTPEISSGIPKKRDENRFLPRILAARDAAAELGRR